MLVIMLLLLGSKTALACYGGGAGGNAFYEWDIEPTTEPEPGHSKEERFNVTHIKDIIDRNKKIVWGGWTPPPDVQKDWREWLNDYQLVTNNTNYVNAGNKDRLQKERDEAGNWPPKWDGLGEGLGGAAPPPWAYAPKHTGKPEACYQSPRRGSCGSKHTRWGWNPYLDKCMTYSWSGCGGTSNNFVSKLKCEEKCAVPALSDCVDDSGIPIEDDDVISK